MLTIGLRLTGSVGRGGVNRKTDVLLVQNLINDHWISPLRSLIANGVCDATTVDAIQSIQRNRMGMKHPDGLIKPDGPTFRFLVEGGHFTKRHAKATMHTFPPEVIRAAQESQKNWGIPASVTLAQWSLESNWGKAMPPKSNNPFGIKAKPGEEFVETLTHEVINGVRKLVYAKFKKFSSLDDAFDEHGELLATAKAYANARKFENDPNAFADALTGVYATDPDYGTKLKQNMKKYNLYQYDVQANAQSGGDANQSNNPERLP